MRGQVLSQLLGGLRPARALGGMEAADNIYLVGYRGSGKSTVGRLLAAGLGRPFLDADELFAARTGQTIAAFVRERGWDDFRRLESVILEDVSRRRQLVLATGGGVVLKAENRARLRDTGIVIWLQASLEETVKRLLADPVGPEQRPRLSRDRGPAVEIEQNLKEREPLYREVADTAIAVDHRTPEQVVAAIRKFLDSSIQVAGPEKEICS